MSRARRRFIIAYIFLVGVPLAAIAGILRAGKGLTAPISVNGVWSMTASSTRLSPGPCGEANSLSNVSLVISQSGKSFSLALDGSAKARGSGVLEGTNLNAPLILTRDLTREAALATGCSSAQPLTLTARVDPDSEPHTLNGSLSVDGCSACAPVQFHAVLQPKTKVGAGN